MMFQAAILLAPVVLGQGGSLLAPDEPTSTTYLIDLDEPAPGPTSLDLIEIGLVTDLIEIGGLDEPTLIEIGDLDEPTLIEIGDLGSEAWSRLPQDLGEDQHTPTPPPDFIDRVAALEAKSLQLEAELQRSRSAEFGLKAEVESLNSRADATSGEILALKTLIAATYTKAESDVMFSASRSGDQDIIRRLDSLESDTYTKTESDNKFLEKKSLQIIFTPIYSTDVWNDTGVSVENSYCTLRRVAVSEESESTGWRSCEVRQINGNWHVIAGSKTSEQQVSCSALCLTW